MLHFCFKDLKMYFKCHFWRDYDLECLMLHCSVGCMCVWRKNEMATKSTRLPPAFFGFLLSSPQPTYRLYICKINWKLSQQAIQDFVLCSIFSSVLNWVNQPMCGHNGKNHWPSNILQRLSMVLFNSLKKTRVCVYRVQFSVQSIMKLPPFFWYSLANNDIHT